MLTCTIERASDWSGIDDIPVPGAYCCGQKLIPKYEAYYPFSKGKCIGEQVSRKWAIQVEHLEDLVDLCESYSGDRVVIDKWGGPRYDYHVTIYDDYLE